MPEKTLADLVKMLGRWEGFEVAGFHSESELEPDALGDPAPRLILELKPTPGYPKRCNRCGQVVVEIHDTSERRVRDLPIGDWDTWLIFPRARLQCPRCGPAVELVPWLDRYQRMTTRLAEKIAKLAQRLSIKHVAEWFGVSRDTVKQIDKRSLLASLGPAEDHLDGVRVIAIDEFAIQRGHRYATVVVDVLTRRVLWICRDRDRESLRGFFLAMGPERCARLEAAAVDSGGITDRRSWRTARRSNSCTIFFMLSPSTAAKWWTGCESTTPIAWREPLGLVQFAMSGV
jgi:transposase